MEENQIKSKQRASDHGEVFTAEREVKAMLDLIVQETERVDSRFLEPACGEGNFLAEILRRKLVAAKRRATPLRRKNPVPQEYERQAIIAITSIYGVDLLQDNVEACRERLFNIWDNAYAAVCKEEVNEECRAAVKFILSRNIVCGNALTFMCVDENGNDTADYIVFSEWSFITENKMQRKDYRFDKLLAGKYEPQIHVTKNKEEKSAVHSDYKEIDMFADNKLNESSDEGELLVSYVTDYRRVQYNGKYF